MLLSDSSTSELIHLPNTLAARVILRNSRIRQGLSLDTPSVFSRPFDQGLFPRDKR